jgi:hypothetical protein
MIVSSIDKVLIDQGETGGLCGENMPFSKALSKMSMSLYSLVIKLGSFGSSLLWHYIIMEVMSFINFYCSVKVNVFLYCLQMEVYGADICGRPCNLPGGKKWKWPCIPLMSKTHQR